jgi:hypothetical protein
MPEMVTAVPPATGPLLGETLEIVGAGREATLSESGTEEEAAFVSITRALKVKFPELEGVPLIVPV